MVAPPSPCPQQSTITCHHLQRGSSEALLAVYDKSRLRATCAVAIGAFVCCVMTAAVLMFTGSGCRSWSWCRSQVPSGACVQALAIDLNPSQVGVPRNASDVSAAAASSQTQSQQLYYTDYVNRVRFPKTKRRLPQCIIVGVRKGGTRALLEFMNLHPRIVKATQEVHFFDDDSKYSLGLEWYRRRMPYSFADQVTVEKSPSYFVTQHVPQRIYAMNPAVRLVVIVRDPVTRAVSDYTQIRANKLSKGKTEPSSSFEALAMTPDGKVNVEYKALQISLYAEYMRSWLETFPRRQVHVVDGDRLVDEPLGELRRIESFLGLDQRIRGENFYFNETKGFFCLRNDTADKCLGEAKGRRHPNIDADVVRKLRAYFAPHNRRFFAMIGHNFTWPER